MSPTLRILQLEDNAFDAALIQGILRKAGFAFESRVVERREAFLAALDEFRPDAVLLDYHLPHFDGRSALALVRERDADLPVIFVTGALGEEWAVVLMRDGANDYILKDRLARLPEALNRALAEARQRRALAESQRALHASEERFRALVEATPDWIWEVDGRGVYTYASPACSDLLGYAPEELLGRTPLELMAPEEAKRVGARFAEFAAKRQPFTLLENTCLRKDGSPVVLETGATPILSPEGQFLGYRGVDRDITGRRQAEASLALQTRRAEALLELPRAAERLAEAELLQFGLDLAEQLTASRVACIYFVNQDQETIELVTWSGHTLESDCSQAGVWADALRQRVPVIVNDYGAVPDKRALPEGNATLERLLSVPVLDGNLVRMLAGVGNKATAYTGLDVETVELIANAIWRIVHQRRAEQALRKSETHLRTLVDTIPDLVWLKDPEGVYLACNPMFERFVGAAKAEVLGKTDYDFVDRDQADAFRAHDRQAIVVGGPSVNEEWITFADDGHRAVVETIKTPMYDQEGRLVGVLGIGRDVTATRRAQDALRDSDERFGAVIAAAQDAVVMIDDTGRIALWNKAAEQIFGYSAAEALGEVLHEIVTPQRYRAAADSGFAHFTTSGEGAAVGKTVELVARRKDGTEFPVELSLSAVQMKGKWCAVALARDITARRNAEQELRKLSLAVEQSPASIVITDLDGRIEYVNPAFTQVSGYAADDAHGQNPRFLQSGRTPDAVYAAMWATLKRGQVWRGEFCNRRKDGGEYVELAIISPVRQPDGQITHYLAVKEDVTERNRVEQELEQHRLHLEELVETRTAELKAAEARSRLILESAGDGIYGIDMEGRATFVNRAACAILGHTPEALLGRVLHRLIHHSRADGTPYPEADCLIHETLTTGETRQHEDVFWHADGHAIPVAYSSHPMLQDGRHLGAVVSFTDITARKRAEAAWHEALDEAERLARLKTEFLANMSHEIRTPLNAVLGFAQIGARERDGRRAQAHFLRIVDAGKLLLGIVNDVLDFAKIEAGKLTLEPGRIYLRTLVEGAADLLMSRARDKGLDLRIELDEDLPATCVGDALRLSQVLGNLLSNAVKFTEHGQVSLAATRDGERLLLRVADTGIGLDEGEVARLFRPFEQADGSTTRRFGGTGLGLAITKRLVDLMHGDIRVDSRPGQGTTFEVRLPLAGGTGRIADHRREPEPRPVAPVGERRLQGLAILVAEDNEVNRLLLEEMLGPEGCRLEQAENGLAAVELVTRAGTAFDLVLMDVQMPVMGGHEATRRIHALMPELPVIGLTAHAMQAERDACLAAGMVDHIAKPVDLESLVGVILAHARARGDRPDLRRAAATAPPEGSPEPGPYIDWAVLMRRYHGNAEFIPKLLATVVAGNADHPAHLREAVASGDMEQLAFIAHGLKGMAGNLFASRFQGLAAAAETSAREGRPEATAQALRLADALDALLAEVAARDAELAPVPTGEVEASTSIDRARLDEVLAHLEALLTNGDTEAAVLFDRSRAMLVQLLGEDARRLGRQIELFDYDVAIETLRSFRDAKAPRHGQGQ